MITETPIFTPYFIYMAANSNYPQLATIIDDNH